MANVNIKFNGKEFLLSCDDGQEEHLEELLTHINEKFNNLKNDLGNIGENKLLLITSVQIMDEYFETKKKVEQKKIELQNLSNKFRELKSLVYNYRDKKEEEMQQLQQDHEGFKKEIEERYQSLMSEHKALCVKLEDISNQKIDEQKKETEFSEKIDELKQETSTLLEEIDEWQM